MSQAPECVSSYAYILHVCPHTPISYLCVLILLYPICVSSYSYISTHASQAPARACARALLASYIFLKYNKKCTCCCCCCCRRRRCDPCNPCALWGVAGVAAARGGEASLEAVLELSHTSAYVSIRQHTSAYVSIRQHTSAYRRRKQRWRPSWSCRTTSMQYVR